MQKIPYLIISLIVFPFVCFGQNANQTAVDTLTKNVAIAVFGHLQQLPNNGKAMQIYNELMACGDGCDAMAIIKSTGGYDAVGVKMEELGRIRNTAQFQAMPPEKANAAIRREFDQFYRKHKTDKNYGAPLNLAVQAQILAKIDDLLPPAVAPEPAAVVSESKAATIAVAAGESEIDPAAFQLSQLETRAKQAEQKQLWMMIAGVIAGLLLGAGAVYLLAYRALKNEVDRLTDENAKLARQNDGLRTKPANELRQPQGDFRQKASAYDAILAELGTDNPLTVIRQLKQQTSDISPISASVVRSGEPVVESIQPVEPEVVQVQPTPVQPIDPAPASVRSEVFYFPPPDPTGQFDSSQKSGSLSPESAYRFNINADQPDLATFRFESEPGRVARFLTYRNYMIEPACDSENSYTTTHTRIAMRRDGDAVQENGVWRVKTKALIRYE